MATTYKTFLNDDTTNTRTMLHEAIPLTGTIVSGTYWLPSSETQTNIKNYAHGMFQSVYDYPYLSSSANHIFDVTVGYSSKSILSSSANNSNTEKIQIYTEMAQVLAGYDQTGSIRRFDQNGDFTDGGNKFDECFFVNYARLLNKDEIKKGSYVLNMYLGGTPKRLSNATAIGDYGAASSYKTNSPAGEYGILYTSSAVPLGDGTSGVGLVYYQAGIAVLTSSIFQVTGDMTRFGPNSLAFGDAVGFRNVEACMTGSAITASCDGFRNRWEDNDFNNTTELNSTIYFCRANHNEFNYSSNPTYVSASKIRVKNEALDQPVSYVTTIGLYSQNNELLAVAKLSEPTKKTPTNEVTYRVRLDY
tara:strand:+ start:1029 stop:2111 length:1083 start_codon:yes stop_codon:yes gene_type:complete